MIVSPGNLEPLAGGLHWPVPICLLAGALSIALRLALLPVIPRPFLLV